MTREVVEGSHSNILIVDDKLPNLRLLAKMLSQNGYRVRAVISGKMAIAVIKRAPPDLILLETTLPDIDGYQICQRLKTDPITAAIPVIFISNLNHALFDTVKAFAVGGVDYILQPFHLVEVLARVRTHLMLRGLQTQLEAQNHLLDQQNQQLKQEIRDRHQAETALQKANQDLHRLAHLDALTQVANRRQLDSYLAQQWQHLTHQQLPLSLILTDIDYFKRYNDTYGHQHGDYCLRQVAQAIGYVVNPTDLVARYGGEEFAIVLPNADVTQAIRIARAIQLAIQQLQIIHDESTASRYVTLSLGITSQIPNAQQSPHQLIAQADQALYAAKRKGRNNYHVYQADPSAVSNDHDSGCVSRRSPPANSDLQPNYMAYNA